MKLDKFQRRRLIYILAIMICIAVAVAIYFAYTNLLGISYECSVQKYFGIQCTGCGTSRMIIALLNFDIYQAFRWNQFMFITIPIVGVCTLIQMYQYILNGKIKGWYAIVLSIYCVMSYVFMVVRNIEGFEFLLPTQV